MPCLQVLHEIPCHPRGYAEDRSESYSHNGVELYEEQNDDEDRHRENLHGIDVDLPGYPGSDVAHQERPEYRDYSNC